MILTIASSKGGVSKTTTAVSVASRLAMDGKQTQLVDLDGQGHAAIALGLDPEPGVFNWLVGGWELRNCRRVTGVRGLEILPGDSKSKVVDLVYRAEPNPHNRLSAQLGELHADWGEYLVIDTPAAGLLQEAAIAAADVLLIPVRLEHLGVDGLNATLALRDTLNPHARTIVLPTQYDGRLSEHRYNLGVLEDGGYTVARAIPSRVAVAEAVAAGQTIWAYKARGINEVRDAYAELVQTILGGGE